jgi:hypothetical protein
MEWSPIHAGVVRPARSRLLVVGGLLLTVMILGGGGLLLLRYAVTASRSEYTIPWDERCFFRAYGDKRELDLEQARATREGTTDDFERRAFYVIEREQQLGRSISPFTVSPRMKVREITNSGDAILVEPLEMYALAGRQGWIPNQRACLVPVG